MAYRTNKLKSYSKSRMPLLFSSLFQENKNTLHLLCSINLHCLPINYHIMFKILLITYKAPNNLAPSYIRDLLIPYIPSRQLRSSSKNLLSIPHFNLRTYGARSFSVAAPTLWNTLPSDIKNSPSASVLKTDSKLNFLKKHFSNFFEITFSPLLFYSKDLKLF